MSFYHLKGSFPIAEGTLTNDLAGAIRHFAPEGLDVEMSIDAGNQASLFAKGDIPMFVAIDFERRLKAVIDGITVEQAFLTFAHNGTTGTREFGPAPVAEAYSALSQLEGQSHNQNRALKAALEAIQERDMFELGQSYRLPMLYVDGKEMRPHLGSVELTVGDEWPEIHIVVTGQDGDSLARHQLVLATADAETTDLGRRHQRLHALALSTRGAFLRAWNLGHNRKAETRQ